VTLHVRAVLRFAASSTLAKLDASVAVFAAPREPSLTAFGCAILAGVREEDFSCAGVGPAINKPVCNSSSFSKLDPFSL
jgi:hypothetical protein